MGAIFGCVGINPCKNALVKGIEMQGHRGNELQGIILKGAEGFYTLRSPNSQENVSTMGLAQCRLNARGDINSADLPASNNVYCVAMDGCVDNFDELKRWSSTPFPINTDEELLLAMLCVMDMVDKIEMLQKLQGLIKGAPGITFINCHDEAIYALCGVNPLFIGYSDGGCYISSEVNALSPFCDKFITLELGEMAKITKSRAYLYDSKLRKIKKNPLPTPEHIFYTNEYNLNDEAYYCPLAVKEINRQYLPKSNLKLGTVKLNKRGLEKISRIVITGDCDAYSAAVGGAYNIEMLCDIPTVAIPAGELRYSGCVLDKSVLVIALSHRGEDTDTIACVKRSIGYGAKVIAITSAPYSSLALSGSITLCPSCDFNTSGISIRAYISQYLSITYLALEIGSRLGIIDDLQLSLTVKIAELLAGKISSAIKQIPALTNLADKIANIDEIYITGLGADYGAALEISRKIKQINGVNSIAEYPSRLIDNGLSLDGKTVFGIIGNKEMLPHIMRSLRRAKAMGAKITVLTTESIEEEIKDFSDITAFNDSIAVFNNLSIVAGTFRACAFAKDIQDKSKNDEKQAV